MVVGLDELGGLFQRDHFFGLHENAHEADGESFEVFLLFDLGRDLLVFSLGFAGRRVVFVNLKIERANFDLRLRWCSG